MNTSARDQPFLGIHMPVIYMSSCTQPSTSLKSLWGPDILQENSRCNSHTQASTDSNDAAQENPHAHGGGEET